MHLYLDGAVTRAELAPAALDVEAETTGLVTAGARLQGTGEGLANVVEEADIGGRVGTRCAADGPLVDVDDLIDVLEPLDAPMAARRHLGTVQAAHQATVEDLVHEGALARTGDAGDAGEEVQGELDVDLLEVVLRRSQHLQHLAVGGSADSRHFDELLAVEILRGDTVRYRQDFFERTRRHDLSALLPRARADVHQVIGGADGGLVVLDHDEGVAQVT